MAFSVRENLVALGEDKVSRFPSWLLSQGQQESTVGLSLEDGLEPDT